MYYPSYELTVGSKTYTPSQAKVSSIRVKCGLGPKVDTLEVTFTRDEETEKVRKGESVLVKLGYEESLSTVFTGTVDLVEKNFRLVKVSALNQAFHLSLYRLNRVYLNQSAGNITSDILDSLNEKLAEGKFGELKKGTIMDGIVHPYYVISDRMCAYEHISRLAEKCNYVCYTSPEGFFNFKAYERGEPHTLKYGENVIDASLVKLFNTSGDVKVYGESPSMWAGRETYHWLGKKGYVGIESESPAFGGGVHEIVLKDYSVKDGDTAAKVAQNVRRRTKRDFMTVLKVLGDEKVKVNDTIKVENMPGPQEKIELQVVEVEHYISFGEGFISIFGGMEAE